MEYSESVTLADLVADLALSNDDALSREAWPQLIFKTPGLIYCRRGCSQAAPTWSPHHVTQASTSTKRPMEHALDATSEPSSPAAETSKGNETSRCEAPDHFLFRFTPQKTPAAAPPAFALTAEYVKLLFKENPTVAKKLRWLFEVTRTFRLGRELVEVKISAVTSRFVCMSRRSTDIIDRVTSGEFVSLFLDVHDSVDRPRRFPIYLIISFPVGVDPS